MLWSAPWSKRQVVALDDLAEAVKSRDIMLRFPKSSRRRVSPFLDRPQNPQITSTTLLDNEMVHLESGWRCQ